ncbi:HD domain-containing protein [Actinomadura sp. DC4]|uniref:HD domain-containing protein n=1 Tax=Actinomadura sp. DC4 TaxID=3055069 RepID=UPI0025B23DEB|nr:HD domain-containing protein [Actinomadura sp. DC4]MDN3355112.1 HD domain-containing protein [Actinomadura sp. DC4]
MFAVEEAIALARKAHAGQTDKAGRPYIDHPLRVMHRLTGEHERMAAILHDVLEDTPTTAEDLRTAGCPEPVIAAVRALTKNPGEPLEDSMARAAENPIARAVKRADIADNSDPARLALLDEPTARRLRHKYAESTRLLNRHARAAGENPDGH